MGGTGQRPANQLAPSTQESAYLAHSADIISCFLFLSLLRHAEQQSGVLFVALHSQSHEALHRLQQLEGDKHKTRSDLSFTRQRSDESQKANISENKGNRVLRHSPKESKYVPAL